MAATHHTKKETAGWLKEDDNGLIEEGKWTLLQTEQAKKQPPLHTFLHFSDNEQKQIS